MPPVIERVDVRRPARAAVEHAAQLLRDGRILILPTETVYGLVARADEATLDRVRAAKGREASKPIARFAASLDDVEREAVVHARARLLARRFWPGPLTLVLPPRGGGDAIGFRVPGLVFARDVVARAGVPVAATSANLSGGAEPITFDDALAAVGSTADVAFDGGPSPLGVPSTVVRALDDARTDVLREGFISSEAIARALARVVLFVCTGNTCRSPMAEAILRAKLARRLGVEPSRLESAGFVVRSAGTSAVVGGQAAEHAIDVMRERGLDLSPHRTQPLTGELLDEADVVYALSTGHARSIADWFPEHAAKVRLVDEQGVPDPVGGSVERYRECADLLEDRLERVARDLAEPDQGRER